MKILTLRNIVIGGQHVDADELVDVSERIGQVLIRMGKAVPADAEPAAPVSDIETASAEPVSEKAIQPKATKKRAK